MVCAGPAVATDQPISATKLLIKEGKVVFVSRDPAFLFPAAGGPDDPTTQDVHMDLFARDATLPWQTDIPSSASWEDTPPDKWLFVNKDAPNGPSRIRTFLMRNGKGLKVIMRDAGPLVNGPRQSVGVRVVSGSLVSCAMFDDLTIQKDVSGTFLARDADASAVTDCSDDALAKRLCEDQSAPTCDGTCPPDHMCFSNGSTCTCEPFTCSSGPAPTCDGTCPVGYLCLSDGASCDCVAECTTNGFPPCDGYCAPGSECGTQDLNTCMCISGAQPCGDTSPTCNGECPVGDECMPIGGWPLAQCGCLPAGSDSCRHEFCGGVCPAGSECNYIDIPQYPGAGGCGCGGPGACGFGGDDCPAGQHCAFFDPGGYFCVPN